MRIHTDCRHFDGYKPCRPHKTTGVHCAECVQYDPIRQRIAILKLGAAGEVVRCTPILRYLRKHYPAAALYWVTQFPEVVPEDWVDGVLTWSWETAEWLKATCWDLVLSLDKDRASCALARQLQTVSLKGFTLDDHGHVAAADADAQRKWATGVFDDIMLQNRRHYVEEIFEICGWPYDEQRYVLPEAQLNAAPDASAAGPVVGLNTGAGRAWLTRLWPAGHFEALACDLQDRGIHVRLLGGPDEHPRNIALASATGAAYDGVMPVRGFMSTVAACDVVVTSVTLALHLAIGLDCRVVLLNNIFNGREFHLFGQGEILEPALPCLGCYKSHFDARCPVSNCMAEITVDRVREAVLRQLDSAGGAASGRATVGTAETDGR